MVGSKLHIQFNNDSALSDYLVTVTLMLDTVGSDIHLQCSASHPMTTIFYCPQRSRARTRTRRCPRSRTGAWRSTGTATAAAAMRGTSRARWPSTCATATQRTSSSSHSPPAKGSATAEGASNIDSRKWDLRHFDTAFLGSCQHPSCTTAQQYVSGWEMQS